MKSVHVFIGAALVWASACSAEVRIIGPHPSGVRTFHHGPGLIEALAGMESLTCCAARIQRGDRVFEIDFAKALADTERDWPLQDGDLVFIPEHVFPCMEATDSDRFIQFFAEYAKIIKGNISRPKDWQAKLDQLPTHTKRK
jgi:hypothetical protein